VLREQGLIAFLPFIAISADKLSSVNENDTGMSVRKQVMFY